MSRAASFAAALVLTLAGPVAQQKVVQKIGRRRIGKGREDELKASFPDELSIAKFQPID